MDWIEDFDELESEFDEFDDVHSSSAVKKFALKEKNLKKKLPSQSNAGKFNKNRIWD